MTGSSDRVELASRYTWVNLALWTVGVAVCLMDVLPLALTPAAHLHVMLGLCAVLRVGAFGTNTSYIFSL